MRHPSLAAGGSDIKHIHLPPQWLQKDRHDRPHRPGLKISVGAIMTCALLGGPLEGGGIVPGSSRHRPRGALPRAEQPWRYARAAYHHMETRCLLVSERGDPRSFIKEIHSLKAAGSRTKSADPLPDTHRTHPNSHQIPLNSMHLAHGSIWRVLTVCRPLGCSRQFARAPMRSAQTSRSQAKGAESQRICGQALAEVQQIKPRPAGGRTRSG